MQLPKGTHAMCAAASPQLPRVANSTSSVLILGFTQLTGEAFLCGGTVWWIGPRPLFRCLQRGEESIERVNNRQSGEKKI